MTLAAEERLDNVALVEAADPAGMLRQVASSAAQVREGARVAQEADLGEVIAAGRPRAVVVTGMGGSGIAGEVLAAVAGHRQPVQLVHADTRLAGEGLPDRPGRGPLVGHLAVDLARGDVPGVAGQHV